MVNEAYLRLVGQGDVRWGGALFFALAAKVMRNVLEDPRAATATRSAAARHVWLEEAAVGSREPAAEITRSTRR